MADHEVDASAAKNGEDWAEMEKDILDAPSATGM
jgi:hypothetical protein